MAGRSPGARQSQVKSDTRLCARAGGWVGGCGRSSVAPSRWQRRASDDLPNPAGTLLAVLRAPAPIGSDRRVAIKHVTRTGGMRVSIQLARPRERELGKRRRVAGTLGLPTLSFVSIVCRRRFSSRSRFATVSASCAHSRAFAANCADCAPELLLRRNFSFDGETSPSLRHGKRHCGCDHTPCTQPLVCLARAKDAVFPLQRRTTNAPAAPARTGVPLAAVASDV